MSLNKFISSVVSRVSGGAKTSGGALVSATKVDGSNATEGLAKSIKALTAALSGEEREWKCHCGHVFRAAGEWYPTEPCYCEAPGCPNPSYYLDGPGRAMLEAGSSNAPKSTTAKSIGGRFK